MPVLVDPASNRSIGYRDRQAFRLIELKVLWEGRHTTNDIESAFGCSRSTALKIRKEYMSLYPGNIRLCRVAKGYVPTDSFQPAYCQGTLEEYAQLYTPGVSALPTQQIQPLQRQPDFELVRRIMTAINQNERLDINYASFTLPKNGDRIISPHSLVNDGARWHVRAWCEKNQDFRDFVLSRIQEVHGAEGAAVKTQLDDHAWNNYLTISIEPDLRLTESQKMLVALDYDMERMDDGRYQRDYKVRQALLIYTLQNLRLDRPRERREAQQITLTSESLHELAPFFT